MCVMTRKERELLRRKEEIIAIAGDLFRQNGYEQTGMDEIAKKAEFARKTLYQYFGSKSDLLVFVVFRQLRAFDEEIVKMFRGNMDKTALERLRDYCNLYYRWFKKRPSDFTLITYYDLAVHNSWESLHPNTKALMQNTDEKEESVFHQIFREGVESGELNPGLLPDLAVDFLQKTLYGIAHQYVLHPQFPEEYYQKEIDYLFRAFAP